MRDAARRLVRAVAFGLLRVSRLIERLSRGLAIASFTVREIEALSVAEWESFGESDFAGHHEAFSWEKTFFASYLRAGDRILVVGAGSGREVVPLIQAGHEVTGLDIAPRALDILTTRARERGLKVETILGSIADVPLPVGSFDVVLFSWFCYGYLLGPQKRQSALARSMAALRPGGRILISYQPRATVPSGSFAPASRWLAPMLGGLELRDGDHFSLAGSAREPNVLFIHAFTGPEIEDEAAQAGLRVVFHDQPSTSLARLALVRSSEISC